MPARIFISYRRDDAAADAGRLADYLSQRFGRDRIFLDVDTIHPGEDFVQVLHTALEQTAAVLIVIGPRWLTAAAADGTRRLDDPADFVRLEAAAALSRTVPVVPVLVQGAKMPPAGDLPEPLKGLTRRQAVTLDYDEFHDDAQRLCDRLAPLIGIERSRESSAVRKWWPAALAALLVVALSAYALTRGFGASTASSSSAPNTETKADEPAVADLIATASAQRRRNQYTDALATLARARELAPASERVRAAQQDVAMEWIRNVRIENGQSTFGEAIQPALAVVDAALPSATGARRADLLAHTGWATFLLWRDGDRRLNPGDTYREALAIDPGNPFANAMLAHWRLFEDQDAVAEAARLFDTAIKSGRERDAVRTLQWAAYTNAESNPQVVAERLRLANAMRVGGERLDVRQAQSLWSPYYFSLASSRERDRRILLDALPPDDHISTLQWAFAEYAAGDESRMRTIRYYVALLQVRAGRNDKALADLSALDRELAQGGLSGTLQDAVHDALRRVSSGRGAS